MTSRVGSLLVAGFLGAIALIAVVVIIVLTDDGKAQDTAAIVASLREGDLVLLNEPIEVRVTVGDDEPIVGISLSVDGTPIGSDAQPVNDPAQGTYSTSFPWQPTRLGFVTISVVAQGLSGEESTHEFGVEVTDNPERLGSGLRVDVSRLSAGGAATVDRPTRLRARARSEDVVVGFRLEVDGGTVAQSVADASEPGVFEGILEWTPDLPGTVVLQVFASTAGGEEASAELVLDVISAAEAAQTEAAAAGPADEAAAAAVPSEAGANGFVAIQSPSEGETFAFSEDLTIDVAVFADDTGALVGMTLFVNTVPAANVEGLQALADGAYSLTIPWEPPQEGTYDLEVVAISDSNRRFDDRVTVTIGEGEEAEGDEGVGVDLSPTAVEVGVDQAVVVTIANLGEAPLANAPVLISVIRTADGFVIDEASVVLNLLPGRSTSVELPIVITEALPITVVVDSNEAVVETDESNNTLAATFAPPPRPDLIPQNLQVRTDGTAAVRISNAGDGPAAPPILVLIVLDGVVIEELGFDGPGPLAPQGTLDLFGSVAIEGGGRNLSAIVDPSNGVAESDDGNNTITINVSP